MVFFPPSVFFELKHCEHASLFDPNEEVWEVLKKISDYLLSGPLGAIGALVEPGAYLINPEEISVGEGTVVEAGAYIVGPCSIGKNCQIRHGAYLRGGVIIGNSCVVGHATEVKNSIFLDGAQAGHFAYVGDTVVGNQVNLGAGVKCANVRFDRKTVTAVKGEEKWDTGLRKFGAIIGDRAQLGCNVVTNPGTLIEKGCYCFPSLSIQGHIPSHSVVRPMEPTFQIVER